MSTGGDFGARRDDRLRQRLIGRAERLAQPAVGALVEQVDCLGVPVEQAAAH
jgi:hypothetical protein